MPASYYSQCFVKFQASVFTKLIIVRLVRRSFKKLLVWLYRWIAISFKWFLQNQRSNYFIHVFYKLIFRKMYFPDEDIVFKILLRCLSSIYNSIHRLLQVLWKYKHQLKVKYFVSFITVSLGSPWHVLKHNLECLKLYSRLFLFVWLWLQWLCCSSFITIVSLQ